METQLKTIRVPRRLRSLLEGCNKKLGLNFSDAFRMGLSDGLKLLEDKMFDPSQVPAVLKSQNEAISTHLVTVRIPQDLATYTEKLAIEFGKISRARISQSWVLRAAAEMGLIAMGEGPEPVKKEETKEDSEKANQNFIIACKENDLDTVCNLYLEVDDFNLQTAFQIASNTSNEPLFLTLLDMGIRPEKEACDMFEREKRNNFLDILDTFDGAEKSSEIDLESLISTISRVLFTESSYAKRGAVKLETKAKWETYMVGITPFEADSAAFEDLLVGILDIAPWEERFHPDTKSGEANKAIILTIEKTGLEGCNSKNLNSDTFENELEFFSVNVSDALRIYVVEKYQLNEVIGNITFNNSRERIMAYGEPEICSFTDGRFSNWDNMKKVITSYEHTRLAK